MRLRFALSALLLFFLLPSASSAQPSQTFQYHAPRPNATNVSPRTAITVRAGGRIDASRLTTDMIAVTGSQSGAHSGKLRSSSDGKTLIFTPGLPFAFGERVTVKVAGGLPDAGGQPLAGASFSFSIAEKEIVMPPLASLLSEQRSAPKGQSKSQGTASSAEDSVSLLPAITVINDNNPASGRIFLSNFPFDTAIPNTPHLLILENNGAAFFSRLLVSNSLDFKLQPDGRLTYFDIPTLSFLALDSTYAVVDTFRCGNGYSTDTHELQVLSNGHALLMSYDYQPADALQKSQLAGVGADTAKAITVINLILQEIDTEKNVVFEWRSQDSGNFKVTDATHEDLNAATIDYAHGNAIELDTDGNWLVSSRHIDEITKINRTTGEIIWRLGGKNNEFQFINDSLRFSHQHSIRRLPNGNIILFDNGNYRPNGQPSFSRAVEYQLDEMNKTATLVWQYRSVPDIYGFAMGSVQRLSNGNTVIGWGSTNPSVTEVTASGEKVYEASLPTGIYSYRAFRYEWDNQATSAVGASSALPAQTFVLAQNYPNPFNPQTTIRYQLPLAADVKLKVFDVLGREVQTLVNAKQAAGNYTAAFNASRLSSGVYFYRLSAASASGTNVATKKMLLVK
ncbi:MAG: aryl-sulfate sulfotransferase [Rhizobacter sp.]|nr:aryl-sulfate sulfotransferase [Chlorobiales bacterium]